MKQGDEVTILNVDIHGNSIVEGNATLVKLVHAGSGFDYPLWQVQFSSDPAGETYARYIFPDEHVSRVKELERVRRANRQNG